MLRFRAVSYCVSGSEENHEEIRQATGRYLFKNEYQFKSFQRNVRISMNDYMMISKLTESGTCATELEIYGVASLMNIDVYTFSCGQRKTSIWGRCNQTGIYFSPPLEL